MSARNANEMEALSMEMENQRRNPNLPQMHGLLLEELDQNSIEWIRNPEGQIDGNVIFRMLLHLANQARIQDQRKRIAVLHPNFCARFAAQDGGIALIRNNPQVEENQAHAYLYGDRQEFDIALIPLHIRQPDAWRGGEHWLLGIYDRRDAHQRLQLYDSIKQDGKVNPEHRKIMRHVLKTLLPAQECGGRIDAPRARYNLQEDGFSCGIFVCYYARKYLTNGQVTYDPEFNVQAERSSICNIMEEQFQQPGHDLPQLMQQRVIEKRPTSGGRTERSAKRRSIQKIKECVAALNDSQNTQRLEEQCQRQDALRALETEYQCSIRLEEDRLRHERYRTSETEDQRSHRLEDQRQRQNAIRASETEDQRIQRLEEDRQRHERFRASETEMQRSRRLEEHRRRMARLREFRQQTCVGQLYKNAMDSDVNNHRLGSFDVECCHCRAIHFPEERVQNRIHQDSFGDCCNHGRIDLPIDEIPNELALIYLRKHQYSNVFFERIRNLNSSYAFASFNANNKSMVNNRGIYCLRVQGQIYHKMNLAAQPTQDTQGATETPQYGQIYFADPTDAVEARLNEPVNQGISRNLTELLERIIREHNAYAQSYKLMREVEEEVKQQAIAAGIEPPQVKLLFTLRPDADQHRFNLPVANEVAAIMVLNADQSIPQNELIVHQRGKEIIKLPNIDPRIEPFVYPLFYPKGTLGFSTDIQLKNPYKTRKCVTRLEFAQYRLAFRRLFAVNLPGQFPITIPDFRPVEFNALHFGEKLFQQYCVDTFIRIERDRINWIKNNQESIKAGNYECVNKFLADLAKKEDANIKQKVILPSTFPGSPRFYAEHYEDAMAIVRRFGSPDFFITVTCNPEWPEIKEAIRHEFPDGSTFQQLSNWRPDIVTRVFKLKADQILDDIDKNQIFGKAAAYVSVIEFQKRGTPHMHLLVIMDRRDKIKSPEEIDDFICAELPDKHEDPELHRIVLKWMVHNPCGELNPTAPCMVTKNGRTKCRFDYPKNFQDETTLAENEVPRYRRRYFGLYDYRSKDFSHADAVYRKDKDGNRITRDNRHVVPYNAYLLKKYNCHINVEFVGGIKSVKYLYKYIYKGHDNATIKLVGDDKQIVYNECDRHVEGRYVTAPEACWRLNEFELQQRSHAVTRLDIHLKGKFRRQEQFPMNLADVGQKCSNLEAYFELNKNDVNAKNYYYWQIPEHYTWHSKTSEWKPRKRKTRTIGRMYNASPAQPDLYHLRLLLLHVKGATCYEDLLLVDGVSYATFKQACLARQLTYDDKQWIEGLKESRTSRMPRAMRTLFAQILIYGEPSDPKKLWEDFKEDLAEDFIRHGQLTSDYSREEAIMKAYRIIAHKLDTEATEGRKFKYWVERFGMDSVDRFEEEGQAEQIAADEAISKGMEMYRKMSEEQRTVVDAVMESVQKGNGQARCFFIDGPGGTGKTYIYTTLYYLMRGRDLKVKNMAYTGIAATLLPNGRTSHKTFSLDVPLTPESVPRIKEKTLKGDDLATTDAFFLDEAPMLPRYGMEIMDRLLRTLHKSHVPFGGTIQVFGGDFRQCLPVQPRSNRSELLDLSIKNSVLWPHFKVFRLTKNQRVDSDEVEFADYLLKLGNGELPMNDLDEIELPQDMISEGDLLQLIQEVFGTCLDNGKYEEMKTRVILSPFNKEVAAINEKIIEMLPGEHKTYTSFDTAKDQLPDGALYPQEYLNSLSTPDLSPHELKLKKNTIIMLLRNLDVSEGMCNGTRLIVTELCNNIIKARIITGENAGREVHITRMILETSKGLGFTMQRHQFPVKPAFAMTIHKSQGQTFEYVGLDLTTDVFIHGQLYVAFSRIKRRNALKVLSNKDKPRRIRNVVWKEILTNVGECPMEEEITRAEEEIYIADEDLEYQEHEDFYLSDEELYNDEEYIELINM